MTKVPFDHRTVGPVGIILACLQSLSLGLFFIPYYIGFATPEFLASRAIQEPFHLQGTPIGVVLITQCVFLLLTVGLTIGVYRGSLVCAIVFAFEVASYVGVAVWGSLFARAGSLLNSGYLLVAYSIYAGVASILLLFVISGILAAFRRVSIALKASAGLVLLAAILIPVGSSVADHARKGSITGHLYRADGTVVTSDVVLRLNPNPFTIGGDPVMPGFTIGIGGQYTIHEVPAGRYTISASGGDGPLYTGQPVPVEARGRRQSTQDLVLVPGGSISGALVGKDGRPVAGAGRNQWLEMYSTSVVVGYTVTVAPDGTFAKADLAPGTYLIRSNLVQSEQTVVIESGKETFYNLTIAK